MASEDEKVFDYGDRTIFTLRAQSFDVGEEYGTMMGRPGALQTVEMALDASPAPPPLPIQEQDPMARLEQKLDAALHAIVILQQKLESIDATLARALNR